MSGSPIVKGKEQPRTFERWVAIGALFVSCCAVLLSVYTAYQTRRHDHLSVQPRLTISFDYTEEGAGFTLINEGLGPAIIGSFVVSVDDIPRKTWDAAAEALGIKADPKLLWWRVPYPDTAWLVGEPKPHVYWINKSPESEALVKNVSRIQINVCYCSMYGDDGECWTRTRNAEPPKKVTSCERSKDQLVNKTM